MSLEVCVLGSGSSGNCAYVASKRTRILIDAGLSRSEIVRRLMTIGSDLSRIDAVCVTHEHQDHTTALGVLRRKAGLPLYANTGTIEAIENNAELQGLSWNVFTPGVPFDVGDLKITPFSVPHDSYDPVGFVVCSEGSRVGVVTDIGMATTLVRERIRDCHALIIESNHDEELLRDAARPWGLKQRIAGRQGHLSNRQAGELLAEVAGPNLKVVFLAHLSADCNRPELALEAARQALNEGGHPGIAVKLTYPDRVSEVMRV